MVKSTRFRHDTERAAYSFDPKLAAIPRMGRSSTYMPKLSEDAQMGYWLAAHPRLHYVSLPIYKAWVEWQHAYGSFDKLLVAHKVRVRAPNDADNTSPGPKGRYSLSKLPVKTPCWDTPYCSVSSPSPQSNFASTSRAGAVLLLCLAPPPLGD